MSKPGECQRNPTNLRGLRTEAVDEEVVAVVFPKHMHLRRLLTEGRAVREENKLDD